MVVVAAGELSLGRIRNEIENNNYAGAVYSSLPTSLKEANIGDLNPGGAATNIANLNANKPDSSTPHAMSEFYKYDKDGSVSTSPGSFSQFSTSGATNQSITVSHAAYSTWFVSSKPSWVSITNGTTSTQTGSGNVTFSVSSNSGSSRSGTIVVTFNVGTNAGAHPGGTNSTTTRSTSVSQAGSDGGGNEGLRGGGGEP